MPPTTEQQGRLTIITQLMVQVQPIGALIIAVLITPTIAAATDTPMTAPEQLMVPMEALPRGVTAQVVPMELAVDPPPGATVQVAPPDIAAAQLLGVMAAVAPPDIAAAQPLGVGDKSLLTQHCRLS